MNIHIPTKRWAGLPAWDRWFCWLAMALVQDPRKYEKLFKKYQQQTSAFIVALWEGEKSSHPERYLINYQGTKGNIKKLSAVASWEKFDSQTRAENPLQWKTLKKTLQVTAELRKYQEEARVGIVYWHHPEQHYKPSEIHILMDGFELPGSPKQ